jgi:hypothetical protein
MLDAGPLWLLTNLRGKPPSDQCRLWLEELVAAGAKIFLPEIADYETRREFLRRNETVGITRLDGFKRRLQYRKITTAAMLEAAGFWAYVRAQGMPTADDKALDADAILAGQAIVAGGPSDTVTIATVNLRHLIRFPGVNAAIWLEIKA